MIEKTFCTTREAAELLGVSVRTTQLWVESGLLAAWKTVGGHRRVSRDSIEQLLHKVSSPPVLAKPAAPDINLKVLIVEDDLALLRLYEARLAQWPIPPQVIVASNGVEALLQLGRELPDLLIADLSMPSMNGFQMLRLLNGIPELASMSIVVVSGLDAEEISLRGGVPENVQILPKPIPFNALLDVFYNVLARRLAEVAGGLPCN